MSQHVTYRFSIYRTKILVFPVQENWNSGLQNWKTNSNSTTVRTTYTVVLNPV